MHTVHVHYVDRTEFECIFNLILDSHCVTRGQSMRHTMSEMASHVVRHCVTRSQSLRHTRSVGARVLRVCTSLRLP